MNTYSQTKVNGVALPFIMGCTKPSPIEAMEGDEKVIYDPIKQTNEFNLRIVGTRSLRVSMTRKGRGANGLYQDRKNEIDDSKIVE